MENKNELGKIRSIIFPIYKNELRKFIPMSIIFMCISINYSILRSIKDMAFLSTSGGAAAISFLKVFGITPAMIIFTIVYSSMSKSMGRDGRFNSVMIYFLAFFLVFSFLIYPNSNSMELDVSNLITRFPNLLGLWSVIKYWHWSLFYINAEAWGTYALSVIFWTLANEITTVTQSKRFYGFLSISANLGSIIAGRMLKYVLKDNFTMSLNLIMASVGVSVFVYNFLSKDIKSNPALYQVEVKPKKEKLKLSFVESFTVLLKSKYMMLIAVLVLCYGMSINLLELVWKDRLSAYAAGNKDVLSQIYGDQLTYVGVLSIAMTFLAVPIRKRGWGFAASITPVVAIVAGSIFFMFMLFGNKLEGIALMFNTTPLLIALLVGMGNIVFIKAAKYVFFDPTKEAAYIPLDEEAKVRGKAAVDGVGSRLGKSLGSACVAGLLTILPSAYGQITNIKQYIALLVIIILGVWLIAVKNLAVRYNELTKEKEEEQKHS
jgi:AAA family ATP:ADP antiporter